MRAACSAWPVICVRRKRRTDRGTHACGRCALLSWGYSLLSWGSRLLSWGGALRRTARALIGGDRVLGSPRFTLPRTAYAFGCRRCVLGCVGCARGGARCVGACGGCALPRTGCSFLSSAYTFVCGRCARGGARSGGLERGSLCRPGEAQCADGRPTVAPREPAPRQGEIGRCKRRDDARCLVSPSACAPRLPSTLPPCRAVCGCAAGSSGGMPL